MSSRNHEKSYSGQIRTENGSEFVYLKFHCTCRVIILLSWEGILVEMKRTLVVIDMNDESNSLIRFVFPYAVRHHLHHIDFIHVEDEDDNLYVTEDPSQEQGKSTLEKVGVMVEKCMETLPSKVVSFNILITRGIPEEEIVKRAKEMHYDLIVLGQSIARNIEGFLSGNIGIRIMENTHCSVLVYNPRKAKWMVQY